MLPHGHQSIAAALCDPRSNEATSQKRRNPSGRGRFALGLRCSVGRVSLHSLPRASLQGKTALCKLCSTPRSGEHDSEGKSFIAASELGRVSRARNTSPIPPAPRLAVMRYGLSDEPIMRPGQEFSPYRRMGGDRRAKYSGTPDEKWRGTFQYPVPDDSEP